MIAKKPQQKLYMLTLAGQGDIEIKLVKKDVWDWMTAVDENWQAPCPTSVLDTLEKEAKHSKDKFYPPNITRSTACNDAALQCPFVEMFWSMKEAMDCIMKKNIKIVDSYEGAIY
jgi:hypothetical protein